LRQRKDELTQKHLDQQRRKQQLKVFHSFFVSVCLSVWILLYLKFKMI
jgi:hypothetical protein